MSMLSHPLPPLRLLAVPKETLWGGRNLETIVGKTLAPAALIGETWETATESTVADGPLGGETVGALVERYGKELLGWRAIEVLGHRFPLLAKFIDAQQWLSVQVHPDDAYAAAHEGGKLGKTETWYILHAEPGAQIVYGLSREATQDEVAAAIAANTLESLLETRTVAAGDVVFVPAGTVHAIGAGVVLYELQQYSDITYRLYDYGRLQADGTPRELHVAKALSVMRYGPRDARVRPASLDDRTLPDGARRVLSASRYFVLEELALAGGWTSETSGASCEIVTLLEGQCEIASARGAVHARKGETVVLPATLGRYSLQGEARLVRSYVPEEDAPGLRAWNAAQG
ncbi:MAG TPA: type I phosphomannose isomerase catalytic subunit [Ktedonobacterales bacterium]|nr:type I phosphomannose isomerase catalytic subunit [Ktedonobacterales bacterium]